MKSSATTSVERRSRLAALATPAPLLVDAMVLLVVASIIGAMVGFGEQVAAPYQEKVNISLSYWSLPKYTLFSLCRGFAAYVLSLIFTLIYGSVAAHNRRAERVMMPVLDVLQSIPVLGFLPGLVLAMIALFPTREIGLEIACIIMIFTAQVWNMTFSFYGSIRGIPKPLTEAARVYRLRRWRVFRLVELPASMIGLVWNSMMSMAGGWFFLTVNEAFTLRDKDFRLPGIGSYMSEAINQGNVPAMVAAVVAMIVMIVLVDQVFWRPIVAWSERFKLEETAEADKPPSWVLDLIQRSRLYQWIARRVDRRSKRVAAPQIGGANTVSNSLGTSNTSSRRRTRSAARRWQAIETASRWIALALLLLVVIWGTRAIIQLLVKLPLRDPSGDDWIHVLLAAGASFIRTTVAVLVGAVWALPVGILIGLSPKWSQRLQPVVQVVASFPAPMLFPLVTMLLVILKVPFTAGCVTLMLMGAQWYILFNVIAGAMAIPADLKEVGRVFRTSRLRKWTRLYIPCVFPYLVTGLITAAGGAWNATIVSEYVQVKDNTFTAFGLGSIISIATANGNFSLLAAGIVTMAVSVVLLNRLFWKRLYRVAESRYSLNV